MCYILFYLLIWFYLSQIIILFDALDEADPAEQQKPNFDGCVMAAGNKALRLILTCFATKLPKNIR